MQFSLSKAAAATAFLPVADVISDKPISPILGHVAIRAYPDGTVMFRGANGEINATSSADAEVKSPGATTVSAATLSEVVRNAAADTTIACKLSDDGKRLEVRAGRSLFRLATLPFEEFPAFPDHDYRGVLVLSGAALDEMIAATRFAVLTGKSSQLTVLGGIRLCVHGDEFHAVATNGYQFARFKIDRPEQWDDDLFVKIHPEMLDRISAVASGARTSEVSLMVNPSRVQISAGRISVSGSVLIGDFPDYMGMAEKFGGAINTEIQVSRADLLDSLRRILAIGNVWQKSDKGVKFECEDDHLTITARSQVGDAMERLSVENGAHLVMGFNPDLLFPALGQISGDIVTMGLDRSEDGKTGPAVRLSGDNKDLLIFVSQRAL